MSICTLPAARVHRHDRRLRTHSDCLLMARGKDARNKKHMPSASRPNRTHLHPSNAPCYHHAHWSHAKQHVHTAAAAAVAAPPDCAHHQSSRYLGCVHFAFGFRGFLCVFFAAQIVTLFPFCHPLPFSRLYRHAHAAQIVPECARRELECMCRPHTLTLRFRLRVRRQQQFG
jgi:hypothetical protein